MPVGEANAAPVTRAQPVETLAEDMAAMPPAIRIGALYWSKKRAGRAMPSRSDIDPADLKTILGNLVMMDVHHDPLDFEARVVGEVIRSHSARNYIGVRWSTYPPRGPDSAIWAFHRHVVEEECPRFGSLPYVGPHKEFLRVVQLACPLTTRDGRVRKILSFVAYLPR